MVIERGNRFRGGCKAISLSLVFLSAVLYFVACKKDPKPNPAPVANDIYAAGYELNNSNIKVAKYWKNGTEVLLSDGTYDAEAASIFVSGADVFVVGKAKFGTNSTAVIWKNGVMTELSERGKLSFATSVYVSGLDVYVVGEFDDNGILWKNNIPTVLFKDGTAQSITIKGDNTYIVGFGPGTGAVLWKNGTVTQLEGGNNSDAFSVSVSGSDVYIGGDETTWDPITHKSVTQAKIWKNGIGLPLPTGPMVYSFCRSVFAENGTIYFTGETIGNNGNIIGRLWVNSLDNIRYTLSDLSSSGLALTKFGDDTYIAGYTQKATGKAIATIWKNGVATSLSNGMNHAYAFSIFAK